MRRGFANFSRADWDATLAEIHPEIEWHLTFHAAGPAAGQDRVLRARGGARTLGAPARGLGRARAGPGGGAVRRGGSRGGRAAGAARPLQGRGASPAGSRSTAACSTCRTSATECCCACGRSTPRRTPSRPRASSVTELTSAAVPPPGADDHIAGEGPEAVLYMDLACPACAALWPRIRELPLRLCFRHFPMASKHPRSPALHAAAEAAAVQGAFWEMADSIYADRGRVDDPHLWERAERMGLDLERFQSDRRSEWVAERVRRDFLERRPRRRRGHARRLRWRRGAGGRGRGGAGSAGGLAALALAPRLRGLRGRRAGCGSARALLVAAGQLVAGRQPRARV